MNCTTHSVSRRAMDKDEPDRELYALLHLSPDASDEEIKRAYRQWAQIYHPDKHQSPQMQGVATENFQRIREAYEILSDEQKRQIYDIYGMEGLNSGMELGPKLKTRDEVMKEFERLKQRRHEQKFSDRIHHTGSLVVDLSLVDVLKSFDTGLILRGMASTTEVQAHISKKHSLVLGGNVVFRRGMGGGALSAVFRHHTSPESNVEFLAMVGLRSLLSLQTSRQLSSHTTGTVGISLSLVDGHINLSNSWTRQLSEHTTGNIQLVVGPDTSIAVGWQRQEKRNVGIGEVKLSQSGFGVTGEYVRQFSAFSQGRITGKIGGAALEVEVGGERRLSDHSAFAMFCTIGIQGIAWKFQFSRGGQKFIIPVLLSATVNPLAAAGALIIPSSLYAFLKCYVIKPYYLQRKLHRIREQRRSTIVQVLEGRAKAEKAQSLLLNSADRKKRKQADRGGLVIVHAIYGNLSDFQREKLSSRHNQELPVDSALSEEEDFPPPVLDVTMTLNFLVDDSGQLLLHGGVKKSGLIGFCDPCPGEVKQLKVVYTYQNNKYQVTIGDLDELLIPQEAHKQFSAA